MAAGPKKAKRRGAPITGKRSASTKPARSPTEASRLRQSKSQTRSDAAAKQTSRKPARGRRAAGQIDPVLAAQLEVIAQGLEQIADMHVELEEMRTVIEELARNVAALVANSSAQEAMPAEPSEPAIIEEVLIVGTDEGSGDDDEEPEPSGWGQAIA
jgi:hypothetical protein